MSVTEINRTGWQCWKCSGVVMHAGKPNFCPHCRGTEFSAELKTFEQATTTHRSRDVAKASQPMDSTADETADAIELAYGMIWHVDIDNATERGRCISAARLALLGRLDKAGQARGIAAAKAVILRLRAAEPRPFT